MDGLGSLLFFAILFFVMMRYGCGAHVMHGRSNKNTESSSNEKGKPIDPVCNMAVNTEQNYGKVHEGKLYHFCSKNCLDKFDHQPNKYLNKKDSTFKLGA